MVWSFKRPRSNNWYIGCGVGSKLFNEFRPDNRAEAENALAAITLLLQAKRQKRWSRQFSYCHIKPDVDTYFERFKGENTDGV